MFYFHIVYASSAAQAFSKPDLEALLEQARENNAKLGLTGMLLYKDGNFMQVLEGEKEAVSKLVETIERDPRHKGVLVLLRGTSEERLFPDWTMGFRDLTDQSAAKPPGYTDFMNTPLTGAEFSKDPNRCLRLLLLFKKNM
jgi:acylphosphatase